MFCGAIDVRNERGRELAAERRSDPGCEHMQCGRARIRAQRSPDRRDPRACDAARDDEVEPGQIVGDIEGEAMHRDPITNVNAERTDLGITHPHPGCLPAPSRLDAKLGQHRDHRPRHGADVRDHPLPQADDRVSDQLAGPVIGDVAAARGAVTRDATSREVGARNQ